MIARRSDTLHSFFMSKPPTIHANDDAEEYIPDDCELNVDDGAAAAAAAAADDDDADDAARLPGRRLGRA